MTEKLIIIGVSLLITGLCVGWVLLWSPPARRITASKRVRILLEDSHALHKENGDNIAYMKRTQVLMPLRMITKEQERELRHALNLPKVRHDSKADSRGTN